MDDREILNAVSDMIAAEHAVRLDLQSGAVDEMTARATLSSLEASLDQCWDLLRQRRARVEFRQDPDAANVRSPEVVENYWG